jgi:TonB-linked SusC/RagA family outer membrane protein
VRPRSFFLAAILVLAAFLPAMAQQTGTIVVNAKNRESGQPIQGAQVSVVGTRLGSLTNAEGRAAITGVPVGEHTVTVTFLGLGEVRRPNVRTVAGQTVTLDVQMEQSVLSMQQLVVTGVTDPTAGIKLPYTVARVDSMQLQVPTANSAIAALQGKVAGVNIIKGNGRPGAGVNILLRSPTAFEGSNTPLFVIDGVIIASDVTGLPTTGDIESTDIESIEVIKGAAAASIYGSRAAAGVISIKTNRGANGPKNQTRVTARTELGMDRLAGEIPITTTHHYRMNAAGTRLANSSGRDTTWAGRSARPCTGNNTVAPCGRFADQPYPGQTYDNLHALYNPGQFLSSNFSLSQTTDATTFRIALSRLDQKGTLANNDGFWRNTARVSIDHRIGTKLSVTFTGDHSKSYEDEISGNPYTSILTYPLFVNLAAKDADGNYIQVPDSTVEIENPLWRQGSRENYNMRARTQGNFTGRYSLRNWVSLDAQVSYDRADTKQQVYVPKGTPVFSGNETIPTDGSLELVHRENTAYNGAVGATFTRQFGDLNARFAARGTFERDYREQIDAEGVNFLVGGTRDLTVAGEMNDMNSSTSDVRANGYFGDLALDFKDRYTASILVRRDGSSLFGPENKWHTYKRLAGAWLLSREPFFNIPAINELKLRYAMGEAGGRPGFTNQYETWPTSRGDGITRGTAGNPTLRPQFTREQEAGVDLLAFNNRVQLELVRAWQMSKDQIILIPATVISGYSSLMANAALVKGRTYEATLTAYPIRSRDWTWSINANADNTRSTLVEWGRSCFWGSNVGRETEYTCDGEHAGDMWMQRTVRSLDNLPSWLADVKDEFAINDEGYVVWVGKNPATGQTNSYQDGLTLQPNQCRATLTTCGWGANFSRNGRTYQWGEPFRAWNEEADEVQRDNLGSSLPDVGFGFGSNLRYKGLSTFLGFRGQIGGKVFNDAKRWYYYQLRHGDHDQSGKPDGLKKTIDYYQRALAGNDDDPVFIDIFLEDGSYLKLGEARVSYRARREQTRRILGAAAPTEITFGLNARNLFTLTGYSGFDPEVGSPLYRIDFVDHPFTRTLSFTVDITF